MDVLPRAERERMQGALLEEQVGRVAFMTPDGPHIIPVNFTPVDESVTFRTSPLTLLATCARGERVACEATHLDGISHTDWGVGAPGRADASGTLSNSTASAESGNPTSGLTVCRY